MLFGNNKKNAEYIVDVHCHIMPGIDDGSRDITETLKMLKIAQSEGITHMIATLHFKSGHRNASPQNVKELIQSGGKVAAAQGTDIKLYQGNEILFHDEMCEELDNGRISRINGTDYVLVEFMPSDPYQYIRNSLDEIMSEGYQPVIAHVERYGCMVDDIENVRRLSRMGVEIQVNASSITGDTGKEIKKKYVLVYQIHNDRKLGLYAKHFAKSIGLPLIRISPYLHQISREGKLVWLPELGEFLSYIKHCSYFITDSFHGTAFALIFNKQFFEILPNNNTGSRNLSILRLTGLENRIVSNYNDFDIIKKRIDYNKVNAILAEERLKSIKILKDILHIYENSSY